MLQIPSLGVYARGYALPSRFGWADGIEYRMLLHSWPLPTTVQNVMWGAKHRACSAAEVPSSSGLCRNSDFEQHQQPAIGLLNFCLVNTNHNRDPNHPQLHHINAKPSTSRHQHRTRTSRKIFYKRHHFRFLNPATPRIIYVHINNGWWQGQILGRQELRREDVRS